jgi:hypothetical protein
MDNKKEQSGRKAKSRNPKSMDERRAVPGETRGNETERNLPACVWGSFRSQRPVFVLLGSKGSHHPHEGGGVRRLARCPT